jgi:hypothetical protein
MGATRRFASRDGSSRRLGPTLLALLGFVPLGLLLWWSLAGPRPEPAPLDWSALGFEVRDENGDPPEFPVVHDLAWVRSRMVGWQAELGGQLTEPLPIGDGRYAAVVREGDGSALSPLPNLAGVVEWTAADGAATRCAFPEAVPLHRLEARLDDADPEIALEVVAITGRCTDDGPVVAVPVMRRHVVAVSVLQRLGGQRPEETRVPHGVMLVEPDGTITAADDLDPELGLPVYPWEVARDTLLEADPDNPVAAVGSWAEPVYPVLAPADGRLWWVMPLAPLDGAVRVSGYLLTPADELERGAVNPIRRHWLDAPETGPARVIDWAEDVLAQLGDDDPVVRPGLPSADGEWHGRVSTADATLRYVVEVSSDGGLCLVESDGSTIACRNDGDVSRR